jgi:hypothetical protein
MGDLIKRQWILPFYWMIRVWRGMFLCFVPIQFINIIAVSKKKLLSLTADLVLLYILLLFSFYLFFIMFNLIRGRLFNLQGGVMVFCFVQKFFFGQHEAEKNILILVEEKKNNLIQSICHITLMLNSGRKKKIFKLSCCPKKNFWTKQKTITPPCKLNSRPLIRLNMNQIIFFFLHQNQNIFFSNIGNQNILLEKNP